MNTERKLKEVEIELDGIGWMELLTGDLETVKANLDSVFKTFSESYQNVRMETDYDFDELEIRFYGSRLENDKEYKRRLEKEKEDEERAQREQQQAIKKAKAREKREKTMLKTLLKKYGND